MSKMIIAMMLVALVQAEDFESFLGRALQQSPYLQSSLLAIEQAEEEGRKILRYENPSIEIEGSQFKKDSADSDTGYQAALSQPIRLWGISTDKQHLSRSGIQNAQASSLVTRAQFIRDIALLYTFYVQNKELVHLGAEEQRIAKKILEVSKARYENGTISRGAMLQAEMAYNTTQNDNAEHRLAQIKSYYNLLEYAGINEEIELDSGYIFTVEDKQKNSMNPELLQLDSKKKLSLAHAQLNTNKVEWMNLTAKYENESDQDIYRLGISIPLAVFNTKSEENSIAKLEAKKTDLLYKNKKDRSNIQENYLKKEATELNVLHEQSEKNLQDEEELLGMFEEAYKIANVNLLELQDVKNRVISTKKRLINIKAALNRNAINHNYLKGNYNECR